jgi:hypothetical protein
MTERPSPGPAAQAKIDRVAAALSHREPDRVPVGEFFWGGFLQRCQREWGLPEPPDPYRYFDLDFVVLAPNMDPHIKPFEVLQEGPDSIVVKTGFECTVLKRFDLPMPAYLHFDTQTVEQIEAFEFDDPADPRRFFEAGDDMINGVGDSFARNIPAFVERVERYVPVCSVFGSVCEPFEALWRIIGSANALLKLAEAPEVIARFVERIGDFMLALGRAQIEAAGGALRGMYLWGDVAYRRSMLFSPALWRQIFKPQVQRLCEEFHRHGLPVIYHGCGNAQPIFEDLIECGVDAYNPLEAKAGLDVVELRRQFGHRWAFNGNIDVTVLASGDREAIRREVLRKLNAAKGGGFIFQSDHSIPSNVAPDDYLYALQLCRQFGTYPLELGEFDEPMP